VVHDLSVNAPEREAIIRLTYGEGGRLEHWTATHPRTGEVMEDATVSYDDHGRPIGVARAPGWSTYAWYGWAHDSDTAFTWGAHEVTLERGEFRVVFQLDRAGRRTSHEVQYAFEPTYRGRWVYDGERLDRIEVTALGAGMNSSVERFAYACP
jgi:hypothetical protein